ncbi:MAG: GYD domain-containing protein [Actinomycetota bacterium]
MGTYITLIDWTDQGIRDYPDTVDRAAAFETLCGQHGAKVKDIYWCLGQHDIVAIIDAPDDETATALLLRTGSLGNIRTRTLRAFSRDEMAAIIAKAGS